MTAHVRIEAPDRRLGGTGMFVCYSRCLYCGRRTKHEVCHLHSRPGNRLHRPDEAAIDALPTEEERQAEWQRRWDRASRRAWQRHFYREPEVCDCPHDPDHLPHLQRPGLSPTPRRRPAHRLGVRLPRPGSRSLDEVVAMDHEEEREVTEQLREALAEHEPSARDNGNFQVVLECSCGWTDRNSNSWSDHVARSLAASTAAPAAEPREDHTQEADANGVWCRACEQRWPCDTVRAAQPGTSEPGLLREVARHAREVMEALQQYGPSIVPHLLDTDENAGQRLRDALVALAAADSAPPASEGLPWRQLLTKARVALSPYTDKGDATADSAYEALLAALADSDRVDPAPELPEVER